MGPSMPLSRKSNATKRNTERNSMPAQNSPSMSVLIDTIHS